MYMLHRSQWVQIQPDSEGNRRGRGISGTIPDHRLRSCINHGIKKGMSKAQTEEQLAVECGYWNNFRFNPEAEKKFTLDSKEPKGDYQEFLNGEVRYNALMRANPEKAQRLFAQNEAEAMERYEYLKGLVNLYDGTAKED